MKRLLITAALAASFVPALALACGKDCDCKHDKTAEAGKTPGSTVAAADAKEAFKMATVTDVASWSKAGKAQLFDANTSEFRTKNGILPGAKLLTSATSYDVAKELPAQKDAKLVFYCANTKCTASHEAAKRAVEAGFTDVSVMPDGLMGWKAAGQPTAQVPRS